MNNKGGKGGVDVLEVDNHVAVSELGVCTWFMQRMQAV